MWSAAVALLYLLQSAAPVSPSAEGLKALEEQRWEAAAASFTKATSADPKDFTAWFNLGFAQSMAGRGAEAVDAYRKTLELKPALYEAELNLGILLLQQKKAAEAVPLLEDAAKQKPKELRPVSYAGEALAAAGQPARAIEFFQSALEIDPKSKDARLGLARALMQTGKLEEADKEFRTVAETSPDVLLELASAYERAGKRDEAAKLYSQFPADPAAQERAGELLLESGKAGDAVPLLESAVQRSPTPANLFALGSAYNVAKQYDKAEPVFAKALQAEPGNVELRATYARVLRAQRKYMPAAQEFLKVAQAKPNSAEAWSDVAGMLILTGNDEQALAALDKVRALGAETAAHHYFRAIVLDKHKMYEPALASYEKFLSMSEGKNPDEEFKARQRVRIIKRELSKR